MDRLSSWNSNKQLRGYMSGLENDVLVAKNVNFDYTSSPPHAGIITADAQLLIGSATTTPNVALSSGRITSPLGTLSVGYSYPNITVDLAGGGEAIDSIAVQTGTSPIAPTAAGLVTINGAVVAAGTNPIRTDGTGPNTMALEVQISQAIAATDATKIGICNFDSSSFSVDANGFVTLKGGSEAIDSIGVDSTSGGGTNPVLPTAAGLVTVNGAVVAAGTNPIRSVSTAANVYQIQVQTSQAIAAADATKIGLSNFDSTSFAVAATGFVTLSTTGALKTLTGDTGTATPVANNIQIAGGPGVTTSATGAVLTINSVVFTDTTAATLAVDNGYFATAAGTYALPATALQGELIQVVCDTAGAVVLDAPALNFIRIGSLITSSGGTVTSTSQGDSLTIRYRLSSLTWEATSVIGTWVVA